MRLIDADKLKRKAQKLSTEAWKTNRVTKVTTILNQFIDWIEGMPTIDAEPKWIPCSERLPSNDGCVLVTIDDGIEFGKYEDGSWSIWVCEHWDKWEAKGTIAWMTLPKPYKENDEDYELATEQMEHDVMYEPTYNSEDGSM